MKNKCTNLTIRLLLMAALFIITFAGKAYGQVAYVVYGGGASPNSHRLTFYFDAKQTSRPGTVYQLNSGTEDPGWLDKNSTVTEIVFDESFKDAHPTSCYKWFDGCSQVSGIVTIMSGYLNTSEVTNMSRMYAGCTKLSNSQEKYLNTDNVTDMSSMFQGCSGLISLDLSRFNTAKVTDMSSMFQGCSGLTSLDVSTLNTSKVTNMSSMFQGCSVLTSLDLSSFNTANVENMSSMFQGCSGLASLDVSSFNTANVENMSSMFQGCSTLTSLDLSSFNTAKVTNMYSMFSMLDDNSSALENSLVTINVSSSWSTESVNSSDDMFANCTLLPNYSVDNLNNSDYANTNISSGYLTQGKEPYVVYDENTKTLTFYYNVPQGNYTLLNSASENPGWLSSGSNATKVVFDASFASASPTTCKRWFYGLVDLTTITGLSNLNTSAVSSMESMFEGCSSLSNIDLSNQTIAENVSVSTMFKGCSSLKTIYVSSTRTNEKLSGEDVFAGCKKLVGGDGTKCDGEKNIGATYARIDGGPSSETPGYFTDMDAVKPYAVLSDDKKTLTFYWDAQTRTEGKIYDLTGYFPSSSSSMTGSISYPSWVNYSANTTPYNTNSIPDVTKIIFDESFQNYKGIIRCSNLFYGFTNLESIENLSYLYTANVTDMNNMFSDCKKLTAIDLSKFNTTNVTSMYQMFCNCAELTSLDLSSFNTEKVTDMNGMFYNCSALTTLDLSSFNTANVTYMYQMFYFCSALTTLNLRSFNTENVTDMSSMFYRCSALTTLDLSRFKTAKVTDMSQMFCNCAALESLDLSSFNTANVTKMDHMFQGCSSLTTILVSSDWSTSNDQLSSSYMFSYCGKLIGGAGTLYDAINVDASYARIDGGPESEGYLTTDNYKIFYYDTDDDGNLVAATFTGTYESSYDGETEVTLPTSNNISKDGYVLLGWQRITNSNENWDNKNEASKSIPAGSVGNRRYKAVWGQAPYAVLTTNEDGKYTLTFTANPGEYTTYVALFYLSEYANSNSDNPVVPWANEGDLLSDITTVVFAESFQNCKIKNCCSLFSNFSGLSSITGWKNFNTDYVVNMASMFQGCKSLTTIDGIENLNTANVTNMSSMFDGCKALTSLDLSTFNTANVTDMQYMLDGCSSLQSITFGKNFSTANVTTFYEMFSGCSKLTTLDLSMFNTGAAENMHGMFSNCTSLTDLNLNSFNISHVSDMSDMFKNCTSLEVLDLSSFKPQGDTYYGAVVSYLFDGCSALTTVFVSTDTDWFNTDSDLNNIYDMSGDMFKGCVNLIGGAGTSYDADNKTDTYARIDGGPESETPGYFTASGDYKIFYYDTTSTGALVAATFNEGYTPQSSYDGKTEVTLPTSENISKNGYAFLGWQRIIRNGEGNDVDKDGTVTSIPKGSIGNRRYKAVWGEPYAVLSDDEKTLTFYCDVNKPDGAYSLNTGTDEPEWSTEASSITTIVFDKSFADARPTSCYNWFSEFKSLTSITDMKEYLNTENVTNMSGMFYNCKALTTLDVSKFDTKNVTNMSGMFNGCTALESLDVSKFDTKNVTNMSGMFNGCEVLTTLDLSGFNTENVTNMSGMFNGCEKLQYKSVSGTSNEAFTVNFDTENVTNMSGMFNGCKALTTLDVSKFDTKNVESMNSMFRGCAALKTLNVSNFSTEGLTSEGVVSMFSGCKSLETIKFGTDKFKLKSNITSLDGMFGECEKLTILDLSHFIPSGFGEDLTDISRLFSGCYSLTTILVPSDIDWTDVTDADNTFFECDNLIGGAGTVFNANRIDKTYARVDGGPDSETPGYFTTGAYAIAYDLNDATPANDEGTALYPASFVDADGNVVDDYVKTFALSGRTEAVTLPTPKRDGYAFLGWKLYKQAEVTQAGETEWEWTTVGNYVTTIGTLETGNRRYQAQWETMTVTIEGWTYGSYDKQTNTPTVKIGEADSTAKCTITYASSADATTPEYSNIVPTAAGEYIVKATYSNTKTGASGEATAVFTISPKPITTSEIANLIQLSKEYDGGVYAYATDGTKLYNDGSGTAPTFNVNSVYFKVNAVYQKAVTNNTGATTYTETSNVDEASRILVTPSTQFYVMGDDGLEEVSYYTITGTETYPLEDGSFVIIDDVEITPYDLSEATPDWTTVSSNVSNNKTYDGTSEATVYSSNTCIIDGVNNESVTLTIDAADFITSNDEGTGYKTVSAASGDDTNYGMRVKFNLESTDDDVAAVNNNYSFGINDGERITTKTYDYVDTDVEGVIYKRTYYAGKNASIAVPADMSFETEEISISATDDSYTLTTTNEVEEGSYTSTNKSVDVVVNDYAGTLFKDIDGQWINQGVKISKPSNKGSWDIISVGLYDPANSGSMPTTSVRGPAGIHWNLSWSIIDDKEKTSSGTTTTSIFEGQYTLTYQLNFADNPEDIYSENTFNIKIDETAPGTPTLKYYDEEETKEVVITGSKNNNSPTEKTLPVNTTLIFSATDQGDTQSGIGGYMYSTVDDQSTSVSQDSKTKKYQVQLTTPGIYNWALTAKDAAGNESNKSYVKLTVTHSVTITYDGNDGTLNKTYNNAPTATVDYDGTEANSSYTIPAASASYYTRTGYTFLGWATSKDATDVYYTWSSESSQFINNTIPISETTEDIILYAVWKANPYTVTLPTGMEFVGDDIPTDHKFDYNTEVSFKVSDGYKAIGDVKYRYVSDASTDPVTYAYSNALSATNNVYKFKVPAYDVEISATVKKTVTLTVSIDGWTYGSTPNDPTITKNDTEILASDVTITYTDSNNNVVDISSTTPVGTYTLTATYESDTECRAEASENFEITPFVINPDDEKLSITLTPNPFVYDGNEKTPTVTVTYDGKTMTLGTDYNVSGDLTATAAGTYEVTVTPTGNYGGDPIELSWSIDPSSLTASLSPSDPQTYDGTEKSVSVVVKDANKDDKTMTLGTDYTVSGVEKATAAGTYTVTVTPRGNYGGDAIELSWSIDPSSLTA
ncbi:MAG: BspA family leucine-rich repeat surface protein, partial [Bacteroidales bacterium]|nr:BspA family leucine-rich repeat surface protein [Bacteroidales bacterium]